MSIIEVENLSVKFHLHHQKSSTLKEIVVNFFTKGEGKINITDEDQTVFWALKDVSFAIDKGESVGIIGRNGAGKSTLLQVLTGIYLPDLGRVESHGRIGLLQIGTGFHPELNGRENIYLNGAILGLKKREIDTLFDSIITFAEVEQFIDEPVKNYSSGMRARLGFSIASHAKPDIMLIDEVLSVGDEVFKVKCLKKIEELKTSGITIVFVSHSMNFVKKICDRGICLSQGQVVFEGSSSDATDYYLNNFSK